MCLFSVMEPRRPRAVETLLPVWRTSGAGQTIRKSFSPTSPHGPPPLQEERVFRSGDPTSGQLTDRDSLSSLPCGM